MPSRSGYALKVEINGKPCMKFAHKLLTASKVKLKTYVGEDYLMFWVKCRCSIVCKGKRYYLPILIGNYDGKLTS